MSHQSQRETGSSLTTRGDGRLPRGRDPGASDEASNQHIFEVRSLFLVGIATMEGKTQGFLAGE